MYTKKRFSPKDLIHWTRNEIYYFIFYSFIIIFLFEVMNLKWLRLPWLPIALIGTAVAFILSFQNNAAYGRLWEARKIWGGIVNTSRTWAVMVKDMVNNENAVIKISQEELDHHIKTLFYRHIAWLTTMRHTLRQHKQWEDFLEHKTNREWAELAHIPERVSPLPQDLMPLLSEEERQYVLQKSNKATAVLTLQSNHIRRLKDEGYIWRFAFLQLEGVIQELFTLQGKSERIKNFPYPRQYATLNNYFVNIFTLLIPLGIIPEFSEIGNELIESYPIIGKYFVWTSIPLVVIVSWVFKTMERIGKVSQNPFEGGTNDVPISTISRAIETDMREMLNEDETTIPRPFPVFFDVQM